MKELQIKALIGREVLTAIDAVSLFRIENFREFPYCYEGSLEYEANYFEGFSQEEKSLLLVASTGDEIAAVLTAMPLMSSADILKDAENAFAQAGLDPSEYFYLGEIIVSKAYRGQHLSTRLHREMERHGLNWNFSKFCLSVVERTKKDPRRPAGYVDSDVVWEHFGYHVTDIRIDYHWPTIFADGQVRDVMNPMRFWVK